MADAIVAFNAEHDAAAIRWVGHSNDWPLPAINQAFEKLYRDDAGPGGLGDLAPYIYEVYDTAETKIIGCLVAANFKPENAGEIRALFDDVVNRDGVAPETDGPFGRFVVQV